jgi:PAS domain S-box-containing protein
LFILTSLFISFGHSIDSIRQLIGLLAPNDIIAYQKLVDLITGVAWGSGAAIIPPSEIIVREAPDGILTVSDEYTIESANQSFYDITGFTPDDVLGHQLSAVFPFPTSETHASDSSAVLYAHLEMMKSGAVQDVQKVEVKRAPQGSALPTHVSVLVVPHFLPSGKVETFTFVLHDLKEAAAKEAEAISVKQRCERLLESALPAPVFRALAATASVRPIFMTNMATIIRGEFVGLRELVSTMSPSQVTDAISAIFEGFEEAIAKYPAVHCIRWSERGLVAVCGLFDHSTDVKEQAEQAARACLDFREMKDEINDRFVLELQYRFSIVQGGPVMGGMFNGETPSFNLLGDIVELGEMLCREAAPGVIRINSDLERVLNPVIYSTGTTPKGPRDLLDVIVLNGTRD